MNELNDLEAAVLGNLLAGDNPALALLAHPPNAANRRSPARNDRSATAAIPSAYAHSTARSRRASRPWMRPVMSSTGNATV